MFKNKRLLLAATISFFCLLMSMPAFATKTLTLESVLGNETGKAVVCQFPKQSSLITINPGEHKSIYTPIILKQESEWCLDDQPCLASVSGNIVINKEKEFSVEFNGKDFALLSSIKDDGNDPALSEESTDRTFHCEFVES